METERRTANLLDIREWRLTPYQILVLGFAGLILFGALLLTTSWASATGERISFVDALFTATSAVCVTGLVVVDTGTYFSLFGQMVIIGLIQTGGLGIMTMATIVALLVRKKINLRERLIMQEALNQLTLSGVVRLTIYIIKVTLVIEFLGGTILAIRWFLDYGPRGIYYGYWHAVSAFCNAGFDLLGNFRSLTGYVEDPVVNVVIMLLIILGGLGFAVLADIWHCRRWQDLTLHSKIVISATVFLIFFGAMVILLFEFNNPETLGGLSWHGKVLASLFQSVTPRTAGYNTIDIGKLTDQTLFFIVILMFIGASPGGTGGGIKTSTAFLLAMAIWSMIRGQTDVEIFQRRIPTPTVYKAFAIAVISALLVIIVTMMLCITEKAVFIQILFEVTSAFGTVGLSTGITPTLTTPGKLWLIITMFAGRVGPLTLALAIALKARQGLVRCPEGRVSIG